MYKKVVLITGGSSGLGRTMANHLSAAGYIVYGTSRKVEGEIKDLDNFKLIELDVTNEASIKRALELIKKRETRLDILINNAGLSIAGPVEETSLEEIQKIFNTNVFGVLSTSKLCLPLLRESRGYIINISSLAGEIALPFRSVYSSSKFALEGLTESLSMEVSSFGIKVIMIQPGDLNTSINQNRAISTVAPDSVYHKTFSKHLKEVEEEMDTSMDPAVIGKLIIRILNEKKPKLRYQVGTFTQKASTTIKKVLPNRIFEKILKKHFHLD